MSLMGNVIWTVSSTGFDFLLFFISGLGSGPLDVRIKRLAEERDDLQDNVRRLKMDLDEEKNRSQVRVFFIIFFFKKNYEKIVFCFENFDLFTYCEKKLLKLRYCENATKFEKKSSFFIVYLFWAENLN